MRISELSRQSGVPVGTIKFYLREGLVPPGRPTGRNQAQYDEEHSRRLRFIRAFTNVGQLDLSSIRELINALDDDRLPLRELFAVINRVRFPDEATPDDDPATNGPHAEVDKFIALLGWQVRDNAPGRHRLVQVISALRSLGCEQGMEFFIPYAEAAERLATQELGLLGSDGNYDRPAAVVRAVLLDVALSAMRRMAQEHLVGLLFDDVDPDGRQA